MIEFISLDLIDSNPWQTRIGEPDPEYVKELALDIAERGLLQTPIGRRIGEEIQLAFGHNRFAAFKWLAEQDIPRDEKLGYDLMPIDVRELTDEQMAGMAWSENEKRRDVTPIERAMAIQQRMQSFGWNQTQAAEHLGIDRSTVSNILRLLRLPQNIQEALAAGSISERVAISLLPMYDLPEHVRETSINDYWYGPKQIETKALNGNSSQEIRELVNRLWKSYTRLLQDAEFGLDALFPEGQVLGYDGESGSVYCGLCRTCDRRIKDNGNICLDVDCFNAKTLLYRRAYLARASAASGIAVVDPMKGGNITPLPFYDNDASKILAMSCENLRLVYHGSDHKKDDVRFVDRFPHAQIICDKRNGSCSCAKGLDLLNSNPSPAIAAELEKISEEITDVCAQTPTSPAPGVTAKQMEGLARQARKDKKDVAGAHRDLIEKLTELAVEWLKYDEPGAFYVLINNYVYPGERELNMDRLYRMAASSIASKIAGSGQEGSVDELYTNANRKLSGLHLPEVHQHKTLIEIYQEQEAL